MLDELIVRNLGVLEDTRLEPGPGLTVITGETGTGKTLLLGALRLLLGAGARSDMVGPFADEAVVEGRFIAGDGMEVTAARRLSKTGRSRAYLDGSIASAAALDDAAGGFVEVIGQHDQLSLTKAAEVRRLIDRLLDDDGRQAAGDYADAWERHRQVVADVERIGGNRPALERERELVAFQASEIESAGFEPGDDASLDSRLGRMRNAEALRVHIGETGTSVDQARDLLGAAVSELRKAAGFDPGLERLLEDLGNVEHSLGDVAMALGSTTQDLDAEPEDLELAEERWRLLSDLRRKYGATLEEILAFGSDARRRAEELDSLLGRADQLDREQAEARANLLEVGARLRDHRARAASILATQAVGHLEELGFSTPILVAQVTDAEPGAAGADAPALLFASDHRLEPGDIKRVASGGELSRLILALRLAGGSGAAETLVFDEIDAGVGGTTALEVGRKLAALANDRQVLCVTHLPQVAAFAGLHYVVERDEASARVRRVDGGERVDEISRMLAGLPDSERGREAAVELLEMARLS